ncbi:MAG: sensor histidine kinase, partial [Microbacteriaceae bacterium]|nr:sensor histidine kinase [Microbacteriaceae bacterium]
ERRVPHAVLALLALASATAFSTARFFDVGTPWWLAVQAALVVAAAAWSWWWTIRRPRPRQTGTTTAIHFTGRTIAAFALTWINPFFGIYAWAGYLDLGRLERPWQRRVGMVAIAVTLAGSQSGGLPPDGPLGWMLLGALLVVNLGLALVVERLQAEMGRRAEEQAAMIAELGRVNRHLERTAQENAELHGTVVEQARRAGVLDERQRLAREIHDTIAQSLAGALAQLQAAQSGGAANPRVDRATDLVRSALAEARRSVLDLSPAPLSSTGLAEAVVALVDDWREDHSPTARVIVTGDVRALHPEVEATVLRVAQEALANVGKHADAERVGLTLTYDADQIALDVRDDGAGFDPAVEAGATSFGLRGMRQRATRLNGALNVETRPGSGTAISLHLPALPQEAA